MDKYLLVSERKFLEKAEKAKARNSYMRPQPDDIIQILEALSAERMRVEKLVECLKRNSHNECSCQACVDVRNTLEFLGLSGYQGNSIEFQIVDGFPTPKNNPLDD